MTAPKRLTLAPLDIPVEGGMVGTLYGWEEPHPRYQWGLSPTGTLHLIYSDSVDNRPRISVADPHWNAHHGLRYIDWYTP